MSQTPPTPVTALPTAPTISSPSTFESRMDAFLTAMVLLRTEINAGLTNVYNNAVDAYNNAIAAASSASTAATQATNAQTAANNAAVSAGAVLWVSGATYAQGTYVRSPSNARTYRRITASGAGTTDPDADTTNYTPVFLDVFSGLPTIRPSLNIDFANSQQVDPRITFTRASTAQRTNKFGLIESVAANVPRIEYDPITGACKGLLLEEQRANLLTYSEQIDTAWTTYYAAITANQSIAPDGKNTGDKVTEDTSSGVEHYIDHPVSVYTNQIYTASVYVKDLGSTTNFHLIIVSVGSSSTTSDTHFSITNGVIAPVSFNGLVSSIQSTPVSNGWYRCSVTYTLNGTVTTHAVRLYPKAPGLSTGDGTSGLYIWGAQLEAGSFATSYIPTTSAAVTRSADNAVMAGTNFSSWYCQDEGSFYIEYTLKGTNVLSYIFEVSDGSENNFCRLRTGSILGGSPGSNDLLIYSGGISQADSAGVTITPDTIYKTVVAFKYNDIAWVTNGRLIDADASVNLPLLVSQLVMGDGSRHLPVSIYILRIAYYPKRLSNNEIIALTS